MVERLTFSRKVGGSMLCQVDKKKLNSAELSSSRLANAQVDESVISYQAVDSG